MADTQYGLDPRQFRDAVLRPTLKRLMLHSTAAEQLVLGTCLTESGLRYLTQNGGGPALGIAQCEPATHADIWANFLNYRPSLRVIVQQWGNAVTDLPRNLAYAVAICRCHYARFDTPPHALPDADDALGMAQYHKRWYNTSGGATDPTESIKHFTYACGLQL